MTDTRAGAQQADAGECDPRAARWLAERVEDLCDRLDTGGGLKRGSDSLPIDLVIVGSGYGGAIAADHFAACTTGDRPLRVVVLERGSEYVPGRFPDRFADLAGHVRFSTDAGPQPRGRREGLFDLRIGPDMSVLLGNGLGGGSLINAGVMEEPTEEVFDARWPTQLTHAALKPHFDAVRADLGAQPLPRNKVLAKLTSLGQLGASLPHRNAGTFRCRVAVSFSAASSIAGVRMQPCVHCGDCFSGCNVGAKNTLDTNYLARAFQRGAEIFTGVTVLSLRHADDGWEIELCATEPGISPERNGPFRLRARRVILAAGTLGSTEILLRSEAAAVRRGGGPRFSRQLGHGFSGNGDLIAVGYKQQEAANACADERTALDQREVGPTITGMVDLRDQPEPADRIVIEELAIPAVLRRLFEETVGSGAVLHEMLDPPHLPGSRGARWTPSADVDPLGIDPKAIRHTQVYATMGDDGAEGLMHLVLGADLAQVDGGIVVRWADARNHPLYRRALHWLERGHRDSGLAGYVLPHPAWMPLPATMQRAFGSGYGPLITVHPLGGCRMADSVEHGVVDHLGRVFRAQASDAEGPFHAGLAVLDGAVIPSSLGINPALTIAAVARRAVHGLSVAWDLPLATDRPDRALPLRPSFPPRPLPSDDRTRISIAEELTGWSAVLQPTGSSSATDGQDRLLRWLQRRLPTLGTSLVQLVRAGKLHGPRQTQLGHAESDQPPRFALRVEFDSLQTGLREFAQGSKRCWQVGFKLLDRERVAAKDHAGRPSSDEDGLTVVTGRGTVEVLTLVDEPRWRRRLRGLWAFLCNRAGRDLADALRGPGVTRPPEARPRFVSARGRERIDGDPPWRRLAAHGLARLPAGAHHFVLAMVSIWRQAALAGERRVLVYDLELPDAKEFASGYEHLVRFQRLRGVKTLTYAPLSSPWWQLMDVDLRAIHRATPNESGVSLGRWVLDPGHLAEIGQALLRVDRQRDLPTMLADVGAFGLLVARMVLRSHFWSFRAPDERPWSEESRRALRMAGPLDGLPLPEIRKVQVDPRGVQIRLARYRPINADQDHAQPATGDSLPRRPVLLVHGFGASSSTFAHPAIEHNLVRDLVARGIDTWTVDLRTSIGMHNSYFDWDFQEVAEVDLVAAVDEVRRETGSDRVDVVAHCIGSVMFCIAALCGQLHGKIGAAVLSQVGHWTTFSAPNRFRAYVAAYLRQFLGTQLFDASVRPDRGGFEKALDRLLATIPDSRAAFRRENPLLGGRVSWAAMRHRADAIFGRLFELHNVADPVLQGLDELVGHINVESFAQTIHYVRLKYLTDRRGLRSLVTDEAVGRHLAFPIQFLYGESNRVFDRDGAELSYAHLCALFQPGQHTGCPDPSDAFAFEPLVGYGHQDVFIGSKAHEQVFPLIAKFLAKASQREFPLVARPAEAVRDADASFGKEPRFGPVLGWLRRDAEGYVARLLLGPSPRAPLGRFGFEMAHFSAQPCILNPRDPPGSVRLFDIQLSGPLEGDVIGLAQMPGTAQPMAQPGPALQPTPSTTSENVEGGKNGPAEWSLSADVLAAADDASGAAQELRIALASCQYPWGLLDRLPATASFRRLGNLLDDEIEGARRPQLLLLVGDQVYADESAGLFDPVSAFERYVRPHEKLFADVTVRSVLSRLPTYCMLDDHELHEGWQMPRTRSPEVAQATAEALRAFETYQWRMGPGSGATGSLATQQGAANGLREYGYAFSPGGFGVFMLDTRTERQARALRPSRIELRVATFDLASIISEDQFERLEGWLQHQARLDRWRPKFIVSPQVVFPWSVDVHDPLAGRGPPGALRSDGWAGFPASLRRLLEFIAENDIRNVVVLSGDYHLSLAARMRLKTDAHAVDVLSVISSGLYAPFPFANAQKRELRLRCTGNWRARSGAAINYAVTPLALDDGSDAITAEDGFAVVGVEQAARTWQLKVDFHAATGATRRCTLPLAAATEDAGGAR